MARDTDDDSPIRHYAKPAGGWDALKSSWQALREQEAILRGPGTLLRTNQPSGFDCPGCAWPDRNPHSTFEFCENGVKAVANESTGKRVDREFFAQHSVAWLAEQDDQFLEAQGRLTEPMAYDAASDRYVPIAWDAAFAKIAAALNALASPNEAIFYTSGRTSNEAAFLYQLFVRAYGTNNFPDCSNMCHEPSGVAMTEQIGSGKGSVTLEDFERADAIFIFGQNPGTNHPRMLGELRDAAKRGCKIVVFNPLRERGLERFTDPQSPAEMLGGGSTAIASHYFQPNIGGDLAVAAGLAKAVLERADIGNDALDAAFIATHTLGFERYADAVQAMAWADHRIRIGPEPCAARTSRTGLSRQPCDHPLLGHGPHPTSAQRRDSANADESAADARQHRQTRRRPLPGARPFQRAGRPHDGHLRKAIGCVPRSPRRGVRFRAAARGTASTRSARSKPCAMAVRMCSSRWAAISPRPRPTATSSTPRCAPAR